MSRSVERRVLPRRVGKTGSRPGITGAGPLGSDEGNVCQWIFSTVNVSELEKEKKMIIANFMKPPNGKNRKFGQ